MVEPGTKMKEKQCVDGVCQFCGIDGYYDEENKMAAEELQEGWIVLSDVTAQLWGIYGEWCSLECFWNDLLRRVKAEGADGLKKSRL